MSLSPNNDGAAAGGDGGGRLRTAVTVGALAAAVLWLNAAALTGREPFASFHDNAYGAYPVRVEAARQWAEGRVPLWNPYKRAGTPLLADIISATLYPGNLPFLLSRGSARFRPLEQVAVLHFVLAAVFMYAFLRTIGLVRLAAVLGALVFAGNGMLGWMTSLWIQQQNTIVWLPVILAALHRAGMGSAFWRWTSLGAVAVALQVFAGYPEYVFYGALVAGGYAVLLALGRSGRGWRPILAVAAIYAGGAALAAVQLLPTIELAAISERGARVTAAEFLGFPVSPMMILGWVVPGLAVALPSPYPSTGPAYLGALAAVFVIVGGFDRRRLFFTAVLVIGYFLAIGPYSPVAAVAYQIPGLNAFRYAYKHLFEVMFAFSILAALGADAFLRKARGSAATAAVAAIIALALFVRFAPASGALVHGALWHPTDPAWQTLVGAAGTLLFIPLVLAEKRSLAVVLAIATLWVSYGANRGDVVRHRSWEDVNRDEPRPDFVAVLRGEGGALSPRYALIVSPRSRLRAHRQEFLTTDYPTEFRVPAIHGCCPFLWAPLAQALWMNDVGMFRAAGVLLKPNDQVLDILACRYVGVPPEGPHPQGRGERNISQRPDFMLWELPNALPPLRFVDQTICADAVTTQRLVHGRGSDLREVALVECAEPSSLPPPSPPGTARQMQVVENAAGRLRLHTELPDDTPGFLVVSQADMPGWHATVDGDQVPLYRTYGLVQGLVVPGGRHDVELAYWPASFTLGLAVSLAAALTLAGAALWGKGGRSLPRD